MRKNALCDVTTVGKRLVALRPLDQLILLLIHSRFADRYAAFGSSRLRGFLEGFLIYRTLTNEETTQLQQHFAASNASTEIKFWKYCCYRLFNAQEFSHLDSRLMRARYQFHRLTSHTGAMLSLKFAFRSISQLLWNRLPDKSERNRFTKKLFSAYRWRRYLANITRLR